MPLVTTGKNAALDSLAGSGANICEVSIFTGASWGAAVEVSGGSPAYARKTVTLAASSGGSRALTGTAPYATVDIPASTACKFIGISKASDHVIFAYKTIDETFANQGKLDVNTFTVAIQDVAGDPA